MFKVGVVRRLMLQQKSWTKAHGRSSSNTNVDNNSEESSLARNDEKPPLQRENAIDQSSPHASESSTLTGPSQFTTVQNSFSLSKNDSQSREDMVIIGSEYPSSSISSDCDSIMNESIKHCEEPVNMSTTPVRKARTIALPVFSKGITDNLEKGNALFCINKIIEECAYHILRCGDMKDRGAYAEFSKRLCERYPCLRFPGRNTWTHLSTKLSQKLRNIRWYENKRVKPSSISLSSFAAASSMTVDDANRQLMKEFSKTTPKCDEVLVLFQRVHDDRRKKLSDYSSKSVAAILHEFPTLSDMKLVREELMLLIRKNHGEIEELYWDMISILAVIFKWDHQKDWSDSDQIKILMELQTKLTDKRIKSKSDVQAIDVHQAHSMQLQSKSLEPPHLVIARHDDGHFQGWVLADGRCIACRDDKGICAMIVDLVACYYAWDFAYPKDFLVLGFIQEMVIGDKSNSFYKSSKFINFQQEYQSVKSARVTNDPGPQIN